MIRSVAIERGLEWIRKNSAREYSTGWCSCQPLTGQKP